MRAIGSFPSSPRPLMPCCSATTSTPTTSTVRGEHSSQVGRVLTTTAGACRLGARVEGLAPWSTKEPVKTSGRSLRITATPARHGPAGIEPLAGDVIGFIVASADAAARPIYITGDTVWYDGVAEVARRFRPAAARAGRRICSGACRWQGRRVL